MTSPLTFLRGRDVTTPDGTTEAFDSVVRGAPGVLLFFSASWTVEKNPALYRAAEVEFPRNRHGVDVRGDVEMRDRLLVVGIVPEEHIEAEIHMRTVRMDWVIVGMGDVSLAGNVARTSGVARAPAMVLVDPEGRVVDRRAHETLLTDPTRLYSHLGLAPPRSLRARELGAPFVYSRPSTGLSTGRPGSLASSRLTHMSTQGPFHMDKFAKEALLGSGVGLAVSSRPPSSPRFRPMSGSSVPLNRLRTPPEGVRLTLSALHSPGRAHFRPKSSTTPGHDGAPDPITSRPWWEADLDRVLPSSPSKPPAKSAPGGFAIDRLSAHYQSRQEFRDLQRRYGDDITMDDETSGHDIFDHIERTSAARFI